eukprot:scaffold2946_cov52-Phaeocystis_antarctica.AAC.1
MKSRSAASSAAALALETRTISPDALRRTPPSRASFLSSRHRPCMTLAAHSRRSRRRALPLRTRACTRRAAFRRLPSSPTCSPCPPAAAPPASAASAASGAASLSSSPSSPCSQASSSPASPPHGSGCSRAGGSDGDTSSSRTCAMTARICSKRWMPISGSWLACSVGSAVPSMSLAASTAAIGTKASPRAPIDAATSAALHPADAGGQGLSSRCRRDVTGSCTWYDGTARSTVAGPQWRGDEARGDGGSFEAQCGCCGWRTGCRTMSSHGRVPRAEAGFGRRGLRVLRGDASTGTAVPGRSAKGVAPIGSLAVSGRRVRGDMSRARRWNEMNCALRSSTSCELPRVAPRLSPRLVSPSLLAPRLFMNGSSLLKMNGLMPATSFMRVRRPPCGGRRLL